ncbi:hypothetical protein EJB05_57588, partial [Eragrostis curvula]
MVHGSRQLDRIKHFGVSSFQSDVDEPSSARSTIRHMRVQPTRTLEMKTDVVTAFRAEASLLPGGNLRRTALCKRELQFRGTLDAKEIKQMLAILSYCHFIP